MLNQVSEALLDANFRSIGSAIVMMFAIWMTLLGSVVLTVSL